MYIIAVVSNGSKACKLIIILEHKSKLYINRCVIILTLHFECTKKVTII